MAITCSSVSAEQGPAIMITSSPPIRTSSMVTMVSSGLKVRLARLYGSVMRSTSWTPSRSSISSFSTLCAPTTPSTVRVAPDERCTSMPELDEPGDDRVDLRLGGALLHYDDHDCSPIQSG